jgi:hypothetical protein
MKARDYINESVSYVIGDGLITYYKNGIYLTHKFISNDNSRKTKLDSTRI